MAGVSSWWSGLSPTSKRNLAVGGIGVVLVSAIVGLASLSPEVAKPASKQSTIKHILTDSDPRSLGIDGISSQLRDLLQKNEEQSRRLAAIEEQQKREQQSDEERFKQWTASEREAYEVKLKAVSGEVESIKNKPVSPPLSTPSTGATAGAPLPSGTHPEKYPKWPIRTAADPNDLSTVFEQAAPPTGGGQGGSGVSGGRSSQDAQRQPALQIRVIQGEKVVAAAALEARQATEKDHPQNEVFIPAGSILTGVLLNGIDAPTGK